MTAPTLVVLGLTLSPTAWAVVVVALLLIAAVTVLCVTRARRLDRLHRRTDAARAGLADALDRRGTVALQVADALTGPAAAELRAAAHGSLDTCRTALRCIRSDADAAGSCSDRSGIDASAPRRVRSGIDQARGGRPAPDQPGLDSCEAAENTLTRQLARVDRAPLRAGLAAELADAEQSVLIARRVHNDAVRDTLDLRSRRLVRWLRLAGTAPAPAYFEIADPQPWPTPAARPSPARRSSGTLG